MYDWFLTFEMYNDVIIVKYVAEKLQLIHHYNCCAKKEKYFCRNEKLIFGFIC